MVFATNVLDGRVALITGGATGIGFRIARAFASKGAKVVLASRKTGNLEAAVTEIRSEGGTATWMETDVRDLDDVEKAVDTACAEFGGLDILIANAAGNFVVPFSEMSPNAWNVVVDIDLNGTFNCAKAGFAALSQSRFGGRFIAISTMRALSGWPGCAHAASAKAGVMSLIRSLAGEWGPHGIRCNTIAPGAIGDTVGIQRTVEDQGAADRALAAIPLGRFGRVEDVAHAAVFLASEAGDYVTGADLVIDGGRQRNPMAPAGALNGGGKGS